jgi:hypothetical protein
MEEDYGYDQVDEVVKETSGGGKFLKIIDGHEYQLRIASKPRYVLRHFVAGKFYPHTGDECDYCGKAVKPSERVKKDAQWSWIVLDREDGQVKVFQAPNSVAIDLKSLSDIVNKRTGNKTWGDPRTFDIIVKRYKKDNGFYAWDVNPDPDSRVPITEEELALIAEADIDLDEIIARAQLSKSLGNYDQAGGGAKNLETAPDLAFDPKDVPEDLGEVEAEPDDEDDSLGLAEDIPF